MSKKKQVIKNRFRGFLPVVVDVETAGVNPNTDALLEVAAVLIDIDKNGHFITGETFHAHVEPFAGANLDEKSLEFNKIQPFHPFRLAKNEKESLSPMYQEIQNAVKAHACQRAVLVGHNAWFDLLFLKAASLRAQLKLPFHAFTAFDTASLGALIFGQTVLAKVMAEANIEFNANEAHSALYDAEKTAELFCQMVNEYGVLKNTDKD